MLTLACTIHKVQGLTLENLSLLFNLSKQKTFSSGQTYVAYSRAKKEKLKSQWSEQTKTLLMSMKNVEKK